jgi:hypothetical protein
VTLAPYVEARHTKLWNYDEKRWSDLLRSWIVGRGLGSERVS